MQDDDDVNGSDEDAELVKAHEHAQNSDIVAAGIPCRVSTSPHAMVLHGGTCCCDRCEVRAYALSLSGVQGANALAQSPTSSRKSPILVGKPAPEELPFATHVPEAVHLRRICSMSSQQSTGSQSRSVGPWDNDSGCSSTPIGDKRKRARTKRPLQKPNPPPLRSKAAAASTPATHRAYHVAPATNESAANQHPTRVQDVDSTTNCTSFVGTLGGRAPAPSHIVVESTVYPSVQELGGEQHTAVDGVGASCYSATALVSTPKLPELPPRHMSGRQLLQQAKYLHPYEVPKDRNGQAVLVHSMHVL